MMAVFPASTNSEYTGTIPSAWFLALLGLGSIIPGCIHYFLPDGGAGVIAHLDMGDRAPVIIGTFAWMGATQIPYGLAQLAVATRYRALVPLFLFLALSERMLGAVAAWVTKGSASGHHPPENYVVLALSPLILIFFLLSLRRRKSAR